MLAACAAPSPPSAAPSQIWPTRGWTFSSPEAQGIDSNALANAIEIIRAKRIPVHSLFVERNGYAVVDAYFFPFEDNETHDLASVTKSVTSTLIGIAGHAHAFPALNQPVVALLTDKTDALADPRKQRITLGELLSMTSGIDCRVPPGENLLLEMEQSPDWVAFTLNLPEAWEPGTTFEYCAGNMHLVSAVLTRATGASAADLAGSQLFAPLGISRAIWPADPHGISRGFADLELQPRDAAKLGYLWLNNGRWEDRQVVPADYLAEAVSPHATVQPGIQYGYGMWLYPSHAPFDFEANGRGGQRITVIPSENLVTVVTSGGADASLVASLVSAAVKASSPLPPNDAGDLRLAAALATAVRAPPLTHAPAAIPEWALSISDSVYLLSDNPVGLRTLELLFSASGEASARLGFADGTVDEHPIGLAGVPRLSRDSASGHRVALAGSWSANGFDLDYDEIARINAYRLHITPVGGGLRIHLSERTGLVDMMLLATPL